MSGGLLYQRISIRVQSKKTLWFIISISQVLFNYVTHTFCCYDTWYYVIHNASISKLHGFKNKETKLSPVKLINWSSIQKQFIWDPPGQWPITSSPANIYFSTLLVRCLCSWHVVRSYSCYQEKILGQRNPYSFALLLGLDGFSYIFKTRSQVQDIDPIKIISSVWNSSKMLYFKNISDTPYSN